MRKEGMSNQTLSQSRRLSSSSSSSSASSATSIVPWVPQSITSDANSLALGIVSTIFIVAGEIMLHIEMFWPGLSMPAWVWDMVFSVGKVGGIASCKLGSSVWCNFALGAFGLNIIDALFVLIC